MTEEEKRIAHLDPLEMRSVSAGVTRYWNFSFDKVGWAIFTVNDSTGEFGIQSDWGNYSHRWDTRAIGGGQTLLEFIATCDADYITRKFAYEKPDDFKNEFSPTRTTKDILDHLTQQNEYGNVPDDEFEVLKKQLATWADDELSGCRSFVEANDLFDQDRMPEELFKFIETPWEHFQGEPSFMFLMVRERLLPFFQQFLKDEVLPQRAPVPQPEPTKPPAVTFKA
jgi:hypothetical protein